MLRLRWQLYLEVTLVFVVAENALFAAKVAVVAAELGFGLVVLERTGIFEDATAGVTYIAAGGYVTELREVVVATLGLEGTNDGGMGLLIRVYLFYLEVGTRCGEA